MVLIQERDNEGSQERSSSEDKNGQILGFFFFFLSIKYLLSLNNFQGWFPSIKWKKYKLCTTVLFKNQLEKKLPNYILNLQNILTGTIILAFMKT